MERRKRGAACGSTHASGNASSTYGLALPERRSQLNKIAFPACNLAEVDAALKAGNNLNRLYELACGHASVVSDSTGSYKLGSKGLKIIKQPPISRRPSCRRHEAIKIVTHD